MGKYSESIGLFVEEIDGVKLKLKFSADDLLELMNILTQISENKADAKGALDKQAGWLIKIIERDDKSLDSEDARALVYFNFATIMPKVFVALRIVKKEDLEKKE